MTGSTSGAPGSLPDLSVGDLLTMIGERDCTLQRQSMALAAQAAEIARLQALVDARDATREDG